MTSRGEEGNQVNKMRTAMTLVAIVVGMYVLSVIVIIAKN